MPLPSPNESCVRFCTSLVGLPDGDCPTVIPFTGDILQTIYRDPALPVYPGLVCTWTAQELTKEALATFGASWTPPAGFEMDALVAEMCPQAARDRVVPTPPRLCRPSAKRVVHPAEGRGRSAAGRPEAFYGLQVLLRVHCMMYLEPVHAKDEVLDLLWPTRTER